MNNINKRDRMERFLAGKSSGMRFKSSDAAKELNLTTNSAAGILDSKRDRVVFDAVKKEWVKL